MANQPEKLEAAHSAAHYGLIPFATSQFEHVRGEGHAQDGIVTLKTNGICNTGQNPKKKMASAILARIPKKNGIYNTTKKMASAIQNGIKNPKKNGICPEEKWHLGRCHFFGIFFKKIGGGEYRGRSFENDKLAQPPLCGLGGSDLQKTANRLIANGL